MQRRRRMCTDALRAWRISKAALGLALGMNAVWLLPLTVLVELRGQGRGLPPPHPPPYQCGYATVAKATDTPSHI